MGKTVSASAISEYLSDERASKKKKTIKLSAPEYKYNDDLESGALDIAKGVGQAASLVMLPSGIASITRGVGKVTGKRNETAEKVTSALAMPSAKMWQGFTGAAEGISDFLAGGATQIAGAVSKNEDVKDAAKWIYEHSWSSELSGAKDVDETLQNDSKAYKVTGDILSGIGNVAFQMGLAMLTMGAANAATAAGSAGALAGNSGMSVGLAKGITYGSLFASAAGSGTAESMSKTGDLGWRENLSGVLKGGVEVATELISPTGQLIGTKFLENAAAKGSAEAAKKLAAKTMGESIKVSTKRALAKKLVSNFAGEATEEMLSYAGGWLIENKLNISDEKFSVQEMLYEGLMGGIAGSIFSSPADVHMFRVNKSTGAAVYAKGDAHAQGKINEGLTLVKLYKEKGVKGGAIDLAEAALTKLATDETLSQTQKEYYMGLAENVVLKTDLSETAKQYATALAERAAADPSYAESVANSLNAIVNEAGGKGEYTAADIANKDSGAARIVTLSQMLSDFVNPSADERIIHSFIDAANNATDWNNSEKQLDAVRNLQVGEDQQLVYKVDYVKDGDVYAVVKKRVDPKTGKESYSLAYTTTGQITSEDPQLYPMHDLSYDEVTSFLEGGLYSEQEVDQMIAEEQDRRETEAEQRREREQAQNAEQKPNRKKKKRNAKKNAQTEQAGEQTQANRATQEDLSAFERSMMPKLGIDNSDFTQDEWITARECIPNIDNLTRREQARILTLVRTANATGQSAEYVKGLARLSAAFGFGVVFYPDTKASGFYQRGNDMVFINPGNLDVTYGHEIQHSYDQEQKNGVAVYRTDLIEAVKKIVGEKVFEKAKAQYKADYEAFRKETGVRPISDGELDGEASANVVGKYLSNMTLLKKIAATDYSLGRGLLAAIRRMKDKWTSAKAFAKENDSTAFAEYRKMTRIEKLLVEELKKRRQANLNALQEAVEKAKSEPKPKQEVTDETVIETWEATKEEAKAESELQPEPFTQEPTPLNADEEQTSEETEAPAQEKTEEQTTETAPEETEQTAQTVTEKPKKRQPRKKNGVTAPAQKSESVSTDTAKISDFGEKIGGARKDEWSKRGLNVTDLENMNEAEKDKYCTKDYVWRRPNYQQLIEGGQDRAVLYAKNELRKAIEPKPTYRRSMTAEAREANRNLYVSTVSEIRDMVNACQTREDFQRIVENWLIGKGYVSIDNGRVHFGDVFYSNPAFGHSFISELLRITQNWDNLAKRAEASGFGLDASKRVPAGYEIWQDKDGTYEIIKGRYILKRGFATYDDALKAIQGAVQKKKAKTRFVPAQLLEVHRKGYNYRSTGNVEGQDYLDTFGFRGGEFGNWMSEKDRQVSMNYGFDALCDLADALGINYRDVSLGGNLAIAFGARGQGLSGAVAHFEPMQNVINLTKMNGAGSLGHEWWHALDKYIAAENESSAIENARANNAEVQTALRRLSNAMKYREATQQEIDARQQHLREKYERYIELYLTQEFKWAKIMEAGEQDEKFKYERFKKTPTEKDFSLYKELKERLLSGDATAVEEINALHKETYGYVIAKDVREQLAIISRFNLGSRLEGTVRTSETRESDFYKDAKKLDDAYMKENDYWSSQKEMAARAFAVYVFDKINNQSFRDDYLVGHAFAASILVDDKGTVAYGYPRGEDRVRINEAFDNLFRVIKEQGILTEQAKAAKPELVSYSPAPVTPETDSRYLSLARDPQKNESELRRLVKEAAEKAGYNSPLVYHGTPRRFNYFSKERIGSTTDYGWFGRGFYFTTKKDVAEVYAGVLPESNVIEAYLKIDNPFVFADYPNGKNMGAGDIMNDVLFKAYGTVYKKSGIMTEQESAERSAEFSKWLKENHYDSAIQWSQIMILDAEQAKRADPVTYDDSGNIIPLSERFNPQNDDIRYSPAQSGSGRIVIQASQSRPTGREKLTNLKGELSRSNFRAALESLQVIAVNAQQGVENQLVRAGLTKREAAAFSQLARSGRSHAINAICYKLADMTGAIRSEGLIPILEPFLATKGEVYDAVDKDGNTVQSTAKGGELAGKRYSEFSDYYAMLHAIDRAAVGKNPYSSMTVAQMKQIVAEYEQKNPDFKAAAEKLSAFNSAMLDIEVQAGIISQETADLWRKQYPHYVPMYTQDSNAVGGKPVRGSRNMEVRRDNAAATESDHRVSDPLRNYIDQVQRRIRAAKLNILLNEVYNSADGVNSETVDGKTVWSVRYLEVGKDGKEHFVELTGFKTRKAAQLEYLKHQGNRINDRVIRGDVDAVEAKDLREREQAYLENPESENDPAEMFRKFKRGKNTVNEVSFYKDGKRVTMAVTDRIYTGLSDLGGIHSSILDSWTVKAVKKVNDTFKKLVTNWNPFFAVKNIARDLQDGTLQSRFGMGEYLNMYRKNAEMMATGKYNDMWEEFLANGGLESSLYSDEFGTFTKGGKSGLEQATGIVGQFQHIKNFNTLTEALPRFTEYCLTRKHGGSVQTALLNAADVTVNFGRSGTLIRILNSTVSPFLNPAVQGLDRVIRLFTEDGIKNNKALASLLLKAVLLAIVPMALGNAMYGDDDEYKDMKDSIKENNYLFKVGDTWLKLPRGRVVSTISGLFNRSYKQLTGQETDWGDYGKNVLDQITPAQNVARHIGSPFYDVANNRTWYGTKIESDALQNYAVNQRYDENTSRISVWIGQLTSHFGLSPKEVNYLIDQYTGVVGDILLPTTTPAGTKGVVSYNFTVDPNTSSNLSNRFYDLYNKTMYKSNDGDIEAYYLKKRLDETKSAVSELFKQIKTINASSELSNKEKVKQASAIRASINQLYKTALDDRRLYEQNIKDALAIENSYAVEKITSQSAKRYGLDSDAVGKYALTFGGDYAKQFNTEAQANDYKADASKKTVYAEANRLTYGAEYALREYSSTVYEKAQKLNELGISYDEYYNFYMTARYYSGKTKKDKILAYLNGSGLSKSQIALMMYYSGYSAYADEAKKAIKASSLSAERKKELLAGITN